jgi:hypothetical protein
MRPYATVSPRFWTGSTGKQLRKLPDVQRVAFYLLTSPHSHQSGIYLMPLMYLCNEIGIQEKAASKALQWLSKEGFATYDAATEWVWVHEMAAWQIGTGLSAQDKRCKGVQQYVDGLPRLPFVGQFVRRYASDFHLDPSRTEELQGPSGQSSIPLEGASSEQEQEQEQEQNKNNGHQSALPTDVGLVFNHWKTVHNHPRSQLDDKRTKVIRVALKSFTVEQVCQSISGYKRSAWHMGQNDRKQVYDDIELFLKDAKHIEAGLRHADRTQSTADQYEAAGFKFS